MWRSYPRILLRDNRKLSAAEAERAREICQHVGQFVTQRDEYIRAHGLDPRFCYPDANWSASANDYFRTVDKVLAAEYDVINRLRLFMVFFSGYSLRHAARVVGPPSFEEIPADFDAKMESMLKKPDRWVARWMRIARRVPHDYRFSPPRMLGEIGWEIDGVVVNHDTYVCQERLNLLYDSGVFDWLSERLAARGTLRILEIGAGYGALALKIKSLFPASEYWICDLPESLLFSALYLSLVRPDCPCGFAQQVRYGFVYMPNYMVSELRGTFDVAINTLSFSEMSEHQLRLYAVKLRELLEGGILFEQNQDNRHVGLLCAEDVLTEYFAFHKRILPESNWKVTQGAPNLWANRPMSLLED
jgi:SAM-dependent methyltransferase